MKNQNKKILLLFILIFMICCNKKTPTESQIPSQIVIPDIEILKPTSGAKLIIYDNYTFQWKVSDTIKNKITHFNLLLSRDGGANYDYMQNNGKYSGYISSTVRSWKWKITPPTTNKAKIRIVAMLSPTENRVEESRTFSIVRPEGAKCILLGKINVTQDYFGDIKFLGEIKNIGKKKASFVKINFTMYDNAGMVIGVDFTYTNPTHLEPNQIGSFECWTNVDRDKVAKWKYYIEWSEY